MTSFVAMIEEIERESLKLEDCVRYLEDHDWKSFAIEDKFKGFVHPDYLQRMIVVSVKLNGTANFADADIQDVLGKLADVCQCSPLMMKASILDWISMNLKESAI